ncbi:hypothetical protein VTO73DRAFT_13745 [Trametes versicolor]
MPTSLLTTQAPTTSNSSTPFIWYGALDSSLGAWLLGTYCGLLLYGVLLYQIYRYLCLYPKDPAILKIWVFAVLLVETLTVVFTVHSSYYYLVIYGGRSIIFNKPPIWTMNSVAITGPLAITLSQLFFARRVYIIAPRFRIVVYVVDFADAFSGFQRMRKSVVPPSANAASVTNIKRRMCSFRAPDFFAKSLPLSGYVAAGVVCIMGADIQLTAVLIYVLRKNRTGLRRTDSIVDILVLYAISTGLLNCLVNVLDMAFALCFPTTMIYTSFSIVLTMSYANSFLTALNLRHSFVDRGLVGSVVSSTYRNTNTLRFTPRRLSFTRTELTSDTEHGRDHDAASRSSAIELKVLRRPSPVTDDAFRDVPGVMGPLRFEEGKEQRGGGKV